MCFVLCFVCCVVFCPGIVAVYYLCLCWLFLFFLVFCCFVLSFGFFFGSFGVVM